MLLKIVSFLSLFLLKQQHTNLLNSFLNSKSNLQYIIIFMLEFRRMNASVRELVRTVLVLCVLGKNIRIITIVWQQKKKPTMAEIFLVSACSTFLETCPSVSSSIWLLVCLTFYKKIYVKAHSLSKKFFTMIPFSKNDSWSQLWLGWKGLVRMIPFSKNEDCAELFTQWMDFRQDQLNSWRIKA